MAVSLQLRPDLDVPPRSVRLGSIAFLWSAFSEFGFGEISVILPLQLMSGRILYVHIHHESEEKLLADQVAQIPARVARTTT